MEQKTLSLVLKLVIVGLAAAGMIVYFAALPLLGKKPSSPPIRNTAAAICRGFRFFGSQPFPALLRSSQDGVWRRKWAGTIPFP